ELRERKPISGKEGFWQPAMQVNYPDLSVPHTRIVEIKHATGQSISASSILREYPKDWTPDDEPYYPIPANDSAALYRRYAFLTEQERNVSFIGRLATYRYYNMDQVTGMALVEADRLIKRYGVSLNQ
ncbi:MAG: UDP-galactopyranose mutase, partial [Verrucomicrobiales bacterium]